MEEPTTPAPRPCSTPHSAPVAWLKSDEPERSAIPLANADEDPNIITPDQLDDLAAALRSSPDAPADFVERLSPDPTRRDGWSPFLRKLFLKVLAEGNTVLLACEYAGMSRESAYALRNRDPLFAAGWDAAALMARNRLADQMYQQAIDGVTDTITRNGEVVATRHRFDMRLSIAVLNRLDRRCDRAEELGSKHPAVAARWDEYLDRIGQGDLEGAKALIEGDSGETAEQCEDCQLPESAVPIAEDKLEDLFDHVWKAGSEEDPSRTRTEPAHGTWMTSWPPPPGFSGYESGTFDGFNWYERACTAEEVALIEDYYAAAEAAEQAETTAFAEAQRDTFFERLRREIAAMGATPPLAA